MSTAKSIPAYPLHWPIMVPRTAAAKRKRSAFGTFPWNRAISQLQAELSRLSAFHVTISTNQPIRNDGLPYAQERRIDDPGVAVYFSLEGMPVCFPCDRWLTIAENMRAITLHIEAMRGQQRWGVGTAKQAFAGYKALTATAGEDEPWWTVLGVLSSATAAQVQAAYRIAVATAHPDRGGSDAQMARINTARDRAAVAIGGR